MRPPARVRPGGGGRRAGEDRERRQRKQAPHRPRGQSIGPARPPARIVARAPGQRDGDDEDQHRETEVAHHEAGREVVADGESAEDRLAEHPDRQQDAEDREIAAEGTAPERQHASGEGDQPHQPGDQPVAVLDDRVGLQRRHGLAVALRPVRTSKAGAGEAHGGAGEHDHGECGQRHHAHAGVRAGGDRRQAVEHRDLTAQ